MRKMLLALLVIVVYSSMFFFGEMSSIPRLDWILLLCGLTIFNYVLRALRWKILLNKNGFEIGLADSIKTYLAGLAFILTPGKMGELMKAQLMKDKFGFNRKSTAFLIVIERVFDILGHVIIGLVSSYFLASVYLNSFALITVGLLVCGAGLYLVKNRLTAFKTEIESLGSLRLLVFLSAISALAWFFEVLELVIIGNWLGFQIGLFEAGLVFSGGLLIGNIVMTPGGIGSAEAGMVGLLAVFGAGKTLATEMTLYVRLATLWFGFLLGAGLWYLMTRESK
ncbi:MAG: flippase-like domain-containing protein [Candidatus Altiarchaeota archaeon]|nr:flippase-like domain-containing protein [Candidatus Altiarchaeota archaeon]